MKKSIIKIQLLMTGFSNGVTDWQVGWRFILPTNQNIYLTEWFIDPQTFWLIDYMLINMMINSA